MQSEQLRAAAGAWVGTSRLWLPDQPEHNAQVTASLAPAAGGKFGLLTYTWDYEGAAQEGLLLIGGGDGGAASIDFADSWHMGDLVLHCTGSLGPSGESDAVGAWSVEGGPDWGWRIVVTAGATALQVMMYVITPEGIEAPGFELALQRA